MLQTTLCLGLMVSLLTPTQDADSAKKDPPSAESLLGTGWRWELKPTPLQSHWRQNTFIRVTESGLISLVATVENKLIAQHSRIRDLDLKGAQAPTHRIFVFDVAGKSIELHERMGMGSSGLSFKQYMGKDGVDTTNLEKIAVAVMDFEGRQRASEEAAQEAEAVGASVLPLPVIGKEYTFELPTLEGTRLDSTDYLGDVVLIDGWATW